MSFEDNLSGYYDVENQLPAYLLQKAREYFAGEEKLKMSIKTVEEFEERRKYIKQYFINAIGGLDIERTPLNPICTGVIDRDNYIIKKIILESQPHVYVTANLYIPHNIYNDTTCNSLKKAPGILFACGHSKEGKAGIPYQKVCIDLAKNGFVVLAVDPLGQGERFQCYDKKIGRSLVTWGTIEHSYLGLQCNLTGSSIARYFIWDLIRALDYLCSLPEVDNQKIGMTGSSGGGTQTAYMMLVDERIKAAVPCNYITSREDYMLTGQAHDSEQNIYGAITEGLNYDDFILCFAPKPAMIGSVQSDFFCIEGAVKSYERAKHIYKLYGREEDIKHYVAKGTHAYNDELRQEVVNWFKVQLKNEKPDYITDVHMKVEEQETLWCTKHGQVLDEFDNAKTVFDLNVEYFNKYGFKNKNIINDDSDETDLIRKSLKKVLNMPLVKDKIYPRFISSSIVEGIESTDIFFFSEKGEVVSGIYMKNVAKAVADSNNSSNNSSNITNKCTILLLEEGTKGIPAESELIRKFLKEGDVFVFDPRGIGAVKSRKVNPHPYYAFYGTEYKLNSDAIMMKTSLTALRIYDILRACDFITEFYPSKEIQLAGKGIGALYVLFVAALTENTESIYLENMLTSFEDIIKTRYYNYDIRLEIYGVLKEFDIPYIIKALKDKKEITCINLPHTI